MRSGAALQAAVAANDPSRAPDRRRRLGPGGADGDVRFGESRMSLAERLPPVAGSIGFARPLAPLTWLRVGGPAEALFQPSDIADLQRFLAALPAGIPVTPLGVCSNLIIRDGGLAGVAIRLGRAFAGIETLPGHGIRAGAAMLDAHLARHAAAEGIAGLEFLRTIPGALGGAVRMNAGCYGSYMADVVESATLVDRRGALRTLAPEEIGFGYRSSALPEGAVVVEAVLRGVPGKPAEIEAKMADALDRRAASQPIGDRSCGSTFRNPAGYSSTGEAGDPMDLKAWKLIEDAGCRGLRLGGARISPVHANFLVNAGGASAADLERLGEFARARVKMTSGHNLLWEIQRLGVIHTD